VAQGTLIIAGLCMTCLHRVVEILKSLLIAGSLDPLYVWLGFFLGLLLKDSVLRS